MNFVGVNKGKQQASVCLAKSRRDSLSPEIRLRERDTRVKADGDRFLEGGRWILKKVARRKFAVAESSYGLRSDAKEESENRRIPYFEALKKRGVQKFSAHLNPHLVSLTHHYCHARAASARGPFEKSVIIVFDNAGSSTRAFTSTHPEFSFVPRVSKNRWAVENLSVYLQDGVKLRCVQKEWSAEKIEGTRSHVLKSGLGELYEECSKFVFGRPHEAGKLMGLSAFGKSRPIRDRARFLASLPERKRFRGGEKKQWQESPHMKFYENLAASVQAHFEREILKLAADLRRRYPDYPHLILAGGCALNCAANSKIADTKLFDSVYVPPFPGDEGISLGAASHLAFERHPRLWKPARVHDACFGPRDSVPRHRHIQRCFQNFKVTEISGPGDLARHVARALQDGEVVGMFQGRSESGPRALGHRSLLADPTRRGIKNYLNREVKGRESFRPYGCSCVKAKTPLYFDVAPDFESPFMSFAPRIRGPYRTLLREITHVDGTSRVQTVNPAPDPLFFRLLEEFGKLSGVSCLLNTSMNVMGEPLVETIEDAKRFFERSPIKCLVAGSFFIEKV